MPTTDNLCATSIMKTIHDKGKDFKEYKTSGSYQENSLRAGLTKEKVMRGEGALLVYATTASVHKEGRSNDCTNIYPAD